MHRRPSTFNHCLRKCLTARSLCACMCTHMPVYMYLRRPEINLGCHSAGTIVLVRVFSLAVMRQHDQNQAGEESGFLAYTCTLQSITEGSQDWNSNMAGPWNLEVGAATEAMEGCSLLACSSQLCSACFPLELRTIAQGAPCPMSWAFPHRSLLKKMPYGQILWGYFLN